MSTFLKSATFDHGLCTAMTNGNPSPGDLSAIANNTLLGNVSGGSAAPSALTGTQATTVLNTFTSSLKGLAPASGGGSANYLRADGSWAAPPGTLTAVTMGGDVTGSSASCTVASINGATLGTTTATSGNILIGSGTQWVTHAVSGDITLSNSGSVTVASINGHTLGSTTPTTGNVLIGDGSQWVTRSISGDVTLGGTGTLTVTGLQGRAVSSSSPNTNDILQWGGSSWAPFTPFQNPSATGSNVAVNGTGGYFMRADACPAIQVGSSSQLGLLRNDGTTITDNGSGIISVASTYSAYRTCTMLTVDYTDAMFKTAASLVNEKIFTLPAGATIVGYKIYISTLFSGVTFASTPPANLIGKTHATGSGLLVSFTPGSTAYTIAVSGSVDTELGVTSPTATDVNIYFNTTGGNFGNGSTTNLTQGHMKVQIFYVQSDITS